MSISQNHIYGTCSIGDASRPVAGTAGNLLPRLFVHFVDIILNRKVLATRRAAQRHCASADAEFDSLAADLALHNTLKSLNS
jgi:hypothetical protein